MTDVIALLAISQLVCLGAIFYLYMQLQAVKSGAPARKRHASPRVHQMPAPAIGQAANARAARAAYGAGPNPARAALRRDSANIAERVAEYGVDVPELARRMRKSEEEVRLLLRRQGIASS